LLKSEAFLTLFSAVEAWLRKQTDADRSVPFHQLVERAAPNNRAVYRYKDDLKEFADLRNAIVHERTDGHVLAEPNDRAVSDLERIHLALLNPPAVIPRFQVRVRTRSTGDSVGTAVTDMREGSFSQLPVLAQGKGVVALLTAQTVVRWMASEVKNELVSLLDTTIETVLPHTEDPNHYCFLSRRATLFDALSRFEEFASKGKDLNAILISEDGKRNQQLLGIITVYDIPTMLETIGVRRVSTGYH